MTKASQAIPKGYKQTEIGVIPVDWDVKKLNYFLDFEQPSKYLVKDTEYSDDYSIPVLTAGKTFLLGYTNETQGVFNNLPVIIFDDFTTAIKFVNFPFKAKSSAMKMLLPKNDKVNLRFIYEIMSRIKYPLGDHKRHWIGEYQFLEIPIPVNESEQTAIATALSDTDALIQNLEKLIAKKKAIKQGAMQQLLTGKKRLPGFSGLWEEKKLGDAGEIITGSTPSTAIKEYWNGSIPWITPTDISDKKDIYNSEREISLAGLQVIRKLPLNTLLVTCIASIGKNVILRTNGACNQQINAVVPNKNFDVDFLYYLIENNKQYLLGNAGITATLMISKKDFSEIVFSFPDKEEQTAIATVLSDMDTEIEKLENKLGKYFQIKTGMMQQLLTGKIRLFTK